MRTRSKSPTKSPALQQLAAIRRTALTVANQQYAFGPRHLEAGIAAAMTFVGLPTLVSLLFRAFPAAVQAGAGAGLWVAVAGALAAFIGVMRRSASACSWREELSRKLCAYEPQDKEAYRALQQRAATEGQVSLEAVSEWLESESRALRPLEAGEPHWRALVNRKV